MVRNLFLSIINAAKSFISAMLNFPSFIKAQKIAFYKKFGDLHYTLNNLAKTNMHLGIYHIKNKNLGDAIFRFKLIDKFWDPGNREANYWLGWVYFLKNNYKKAIMHLTKAGNEDRVNLLPFVMNIDNVKEVPKEIYALHRDIMSELFIDKFASETENIPKSLVAELNNVITTLPDQYSILELGSNIGLESFEITKRMQDSYYFTGVEISAEMIKAQLACFPDVKYDKIIQSSVSNFLEYNKNKYNVIISLDGFSYTMDLPDIFLRIFNHLEPLGYLAFALRTKPSISFSNKYLEFSYNRDKIIEQLNKSGLKLLSAKEFTLEIKNNYSIFVCIKE